MQLSEPPGWPDAASCTISTASSLAFAAVSFSCVNLVFSMCFPSFAAARSLFLCCFTAARLFVCVAFLLYYTTLVQTFPVLLLSFFGFFSKLSYSHKSGPVFCENPPKRAPLPTAKSGSNRSSSANFEAQFFKLCIGAGIRPPRAIKSAAEAVCTGMIGAEPSRPPNSTRLALRPCPARG